MYNWQRGLDSAEIPRLLWYPKVHCHVHKSLPLVLILGPHREDPESYEMLKGGTFLDCLSDH